MSEKISKFDLFEGIFIFCISFMFFFIAVGRLTILKDLSSDFSNFTDIMFEFSIVYVVLMFFVGDIFKKTKLFADYIEQRRVK